MLHNWYFDTTNPIFTFKGIKFSVSIFTKTNRYDVDPTKVETLEKENEFIVKCEGLTWAGGQEKDKGSIDVKVVFKNNRYYFDLKANKNEIIKKAKITLFEESLGEVIARRRYTQQISPLGQIYRYPNGWDDLFTPLIAIKNDKDVRFYRSLDNVVRPKAFVLTRIDDKAKVEMVFEEDLKVVSNTLTMPTIEVGNVNRFEEIFEEQRKFIEKEYNLVKWEDRKDVPNWAKKISLVISLHGMHWSGYIFNTYKQMEEKLSWFANYIDPHKVLVYIPGFDGRYYFKYPNYDPDERMGGKEGLKHLIDFAHNLGYHIMPMFMINGANPDTKGFDIWGETSIYYSSSGYPRGVGSCDWDTSRGYNLNCGIGLNPGAPLWQDYFVNEANRQIKEYKFDAIFLDLAAIYENDPRYSTHDGAISIINRLHQANKELLISTEGWYDALSSVFPFSQCAGQENLGGEMVYQDSPYAPLFDTYNRMFGHLCLGDLASGRNGVFEWGINLAERKLPLRKGIIQTITVLDDTIEKAKDEILNVIALANEYDNNFIK